MTSIYEIQGVSYLNGGDYLGTSPSLEEAKVWAKAKARLFPEYQVIQVVDVAATIRAKYKTKG